MNVFKIKHLLLVLSFFMATNSLAMEERPSAWRLITGILMGWIPISSISELLAEPELRILPEDTQNYIIELLYMGATGGTLTESAGAIHSLAQVNKKWNAFFNDMQFSCDLVKRFAQKFDCSEETVCLALSTKTTKEYLQANTELLQKFLLKNTHGVSPQNISCSLPNDVNFRLNSLGETIIFPHTTHNKTSYPIIMPIFPGGGNLIMYLYSISPTSYINTIIEQQCSININLANNNGKTALMFAVYNPWGKQSGDKNIVAHLLSHFSNVDINKQDRYGNTALLHALRTYIMIVGRLKSSLLYREIPITHDIDPDINTIKILLEHGADPELADYDGLTPLQAAIKTDNDAIIQLIKEAIRAKHSLLGSSGSQD